MNTFAREEANDMGKRLDAEFANPRRAKIFGRFVDESGADNKIGFLLCDRFD